MTPQDASRSELGSSLVSTLVILVAVFSLTIAGLLSSRWAIKTSENYLTEIQALHAAEAGALHAQKTIDDLGVVSFDTDIVSTWSTVFGSDTRRMPGYRTITYSATAANDPNDPSAYMLLTVLGTAPNDSQRSIQARLHREGVFSPGAIYLPNENISTSFSGNSFLIDGHDKNLDGSPHPSGDAPGIGTSTTSAANSVTSSLSAQQANNVVGSGGIPSVQMNSGPSASRLQNSIIPRMLSQPGIVTNPALSGNDTFGTISNPQITHFTGNVTINGSLSGAGILIVDQGLTINGNASFTGLILVRGTTAITAVQGSATLLGSLWTTDLTLTVSGTASVTYSSQAMALANGLGPNGLLPQRVKAVSWNEL